MLSTSRKAVMLVCIVLHGRLPHCVWGFTIQPFQTIAQYVYACHLSTLCTPKQRFWVVYYMSHALQAIAPMYAACDSHDHGFSHRFPDVLRTSSILCKFTNQIHCKVGNSNKLQASLRRQSRSSSIILTASFWVSAHCATRLTWGPQTIAQTGFRLASALSTHIRLKE